MTPLICRLRPQSSELPARARWLSGSHADVLSVTSRNIRATGPSDFQSHLRLRSRPLVNSAHSDLVNLVDVYSDGIGRPLDRRATSQSVIRQVRDRSSAPRMTEDSACLWLKGARVQDLSWIPSLLPENSHQTTGTLRDGGTSVARGMVLNLPSSWWDTAKSCRQEYQSWS